MTKAAAISNVREYLRNGLLASDMAERIAVRSESQGKGENPELESYLSKTIAPKLEKLGFGCRIMQNMGSSWPILFAERFESESFPTVLTYGHGDVVNGDDHLWREGLSPWKLVIEDGKWYGRGTADNKGQHSINLAALEAVIAARNGKLGFNIKILFETAEECGSPGLREFCDQNKDVLKADVFIASDGPRLTKDRPTIFLGSRGIAQFTLALRARAQPLHSGNWGGVMTNPAIVLANALSVLVDGRGKILCEGLLPEEIPNSVKSCISDLDVTESSLGKKLNQEWGETTLTLGERLFGWNTLEVLALEAGNPTSPMNAIPPKAKAYCQLRFVVGTDWENLDAIIRKHLDDNGFHDVTVDVTRISPATRLDPENFWVKWAHGAIATATNRKLAIVPNLAGTLPNDIFSSVLGLPTLWVPHSYPGCGQHGPNEHLLDEVIVEGLEVMASVFWDLGNIASHAR